jgi:hypothetical protein
MPCETMSSKEHKRLKDSFRIPFYTLFLPPLPPLFLRAFTETVIVTHVPRYCIITPSIFKTKDL